MGSTPSWRHEGRGVPDSETWSADLCPSDVHVQQMTDLQRKKDQPILGGQGKEYNYGVTSRFKGA